ncbi:MAG TPA: ABC transporter ATP-binding protein [Desulfitobacterium dehalogenans]|uniref:ABC transporter ATP-binding protein n=1 Tax=Desulfitobacterium dehalogenans TaxID=36854 RepID=A0A7C7D5R6_9FIRM|nr:ABC transporter ATP-binding protein [Desulfitobacterium dehalogenans]
MILQVENISKSFGGVEALSDISFSFSQGQIGAFIGPNGAGKTTLINVLSGILQPCQGTILLYNQPLSGLSSQEISKLGIARTFQNLQIFTNMTVLENVMVGCHIHGKTGLLQAAFRLGTAQEERRIREKSMALLAKVGLVHFADEPAENLPFGQKRLLEIARALAIEPKILLLDEPAAGLNPTETRFLVELIYSIRQAGVTVLLVEHDMDTVMEVADKVVVLDFGRKIAEGSPKEICCDPRVIQAYLGEEVSNPA